MTENEPQKASRPYRQWIFYFKSFKRYVVLLTLFILLIGSINILINQPYYQKKLAQKILENNGPEITFDELHLNLFSGVIAGENLAVESHKTKLKLALNQFKVQFSPLHFFLLQLNLRSVTADRIFIDMGEMTKADSNPSIDPQIEKKPPSNLPLFLQRLALQSAKINQLFINRGQKGFVSIKNIQLKSQKGLLLTSAEKVLSAQDIRAVTPKVQNFIDSVTLVGFFELDLSQEHLLNQTHSQGHIQIQNFLLSIDKKPKPWLTNPAWDSDLEPILLQYFEAPLTLNKTHFYLQAIDFQTSFLQDEISLHDLKVRLDKSLIEGSLRWEPTTKEFYAELKADDPLSVSKLPLGQAQIRTAFEGLQFHLKAEGELENLAKNNIKLNLKATATGNKVHPEAKDLNITLTSRLKDSVFITDDLTANLADGKIFAGGIFNITNQNIGIKFKSENFDAQTVVRLFSTINIPSKVDGQGYIQGSIRDPLIYAELESKNAAYEFLNFGQASAKLKVQNKNLELNVKSQNSTVGTSSLDLKISEVYNSFEQNLKLFTEFTKLKINQVINTQTLDGEISGVFNLNRKNNQNLGSGMANVLGLKILNQDYGNLTAPFTLKQKHLELKPLQMQFFSAELNLKSEKGLTFDFNDKGYVFSGEPLPNMTIKGEFAKSNKSILQVQGQFQNFDLNILKPFYPFDITESHATVGFKGAYNIYDPWQSDLNLKCDDLFIKTPETEIKLKKTAQIDYKNHIFTFKNFNLLHGAGDVTLDGALALNTGSNLHVWGTLDFNSIGEMNPFVSFSEKPVALDVKIKGETLKPDLFGRVTLTDNDIEFRKLQNDFEKLNGTIEFDGKKISSPHFKLFMNDGELELAGWLKTDYTVITSADLKIRGNEIPFHMQNGTDVLSDLDLTLQGQKSLKIFGAMNVVQGEYKRNYGVNNFIIKAQDINEDENSSRWSMLPAETTLDIDIKNTGEFLVNNNLAYLELNIDLDLLGTLKTPMLNGQIDFLNGKIHSLGVYFEEASGYAQFHPEPQINPVINLKASTQIQNYAIIAHATGTLDNLKLLLDSNPTLDRKDIMSLLFYGQTSDQLIGNANDDFLQTAAITQLATVLSQPLSKVSGLDYFNVTQRQDNSQYATQKISIGKSLTDRLNLAFTSDVNNNEDPERAIEMGFQIFDAFSVVFAKDFSDRYRFDLNLRFESY